MGKVASGNIEPRLHSNRGSQFPERSKSRTQKTKKKKGSGIIGTLKGVGGTPRWKRGKVTEGECKRQHKTERSGKDQKMGEAGGVLF